MKTILASITLKFSQFNKILTVALNKIRIVEKRVRSDE